MNALKRKNYEATCPTASNRGPSLCLGLLPEHLVAELTGRQLGQIVRLMEATYQDAWSAAGGGVGTVHHCEDYRRALLMKLTR